MEDQVSSSRERNKEKSKQKFLIAVGKILRKKGFSGLKVNDIAATAGLDKKLIYRYFGGTDGLLDEYIRKQDFWLNVKDDKVPSVIEDGGRAFSKGMLLEQFDYMFQNKEYQKIMLWKLSEQRNALQKMTDEQEEIGEVLLKGITDPHFKDKAETYRAIMAVLISGVYYLNLTTAANGSIFCGIDVKEEAGRTKIKEALSFLVEQTYEHL